MTLACDIGLDMKPPKIELSDKQLDMLEKGLQQAWVLAIGGALLLVGLVFLLFSITPEQLGR